MKKCLKRLSSRKARQNPSWRLCESSWKKAGRYLRAAPWPHATGLASAVLGLSLVGKALALYDGGFLWTGSAVAASALGWLGLAFLCEADALSRYREYLRLKRLFLRRGLHPRALLLVSGSRCQRDAALFAAKEAGYGGQAAAFYASMGYRWRHVLPDAILRNPFFFFNPAFLRATFLPGKSTGRGAPEPSEALACRL